MSMINCPECGKEISDKAESCPNCGAKVEKKEVKARVSESFCFISLIVSAFLCMCGIYGICVGYLITLFWLAIYESKYNKYKKDSTLDCSNIKRTRDAIIIFLFLNFGIVIMF